MKNNKLIFFHAICFIIILNGCNSLPQNIDQTTAIKGSIFYFDSVDYVTKSFTIRNIDSVKRIISIIKQPVLKPNGTHVIDYLASVEINCFNMNNETVGYFFIHIDVPGKGTLIDGFENEFSFPKFASENTCIGIFFKNYAKKIGCQMQTKPNYPKGDLWIKNCETDF